MNALEGPSPHSVPVGVVGVAVGVELPGVAVVGWVLSVGGAIVVAGKQGEIR